MRRSWRCGYTLVELLMVLGIIALLLGILVTAFSQSIGNARRTQCLSNLHNLSVAFQLYRSDFDDYFPPIYAGKTSDTPGQELQDISRHWTSLLFPYLKVNVFPFCPAREAPFGTEIAETDNLLLSGYLYNKNLGDLLVVREHKETFYRTIHESQLEFPARTVCVGEGRIGLLAASTPDIEGNEVFLRYETVTALPLSDLQKLSPGGQRHNGGANYVFADGHTHWHSAADLKKGNVSSPTFALGLRQN